MSNNNNSWKRVGGFSRTGTQNYVRTTDAAMGGTTFGPTDISYNSGNTTLRIGNNAGVVFVNGDIDMNGGPTVVAPINRIRNVRDPIMDQDVATKFYVDKTVLALKLENQEMGPTGPNGPPGIGLSGQDGQQGPTGSTGCTGAAGPPGSVIGVTGATGRSGATGATGTSGAPGATGPAGPAGLKGDQGEQGIQGIQGSNGTILWLNPDGDYSTDQLITDSYLLSQTPINSIMRTVGPISVSATYGNSNKIVPGSRFYNTARKMSDFSVIPSGVWVLNIYANVPSNSDANQVSLYAAVFMISGTYDQPSPDSLIIETKDGGDSGFYPPRAAYLPDHVKYIGKSWTNTENVLTDNNTGVLINSTARKLYKIEMPVEFITLRDANGNRDNVYVQLQIYVKNTKAANQTANVSLFFQTNPNTNETTYSYLQTTFGAIGIQGLQGPLGPTGPNGVPGTTGSTGLMGRTGIAGPTGSTGTIGPAGPQGPTGVAGPPGGSSSYGVQYSIQYRSNAGSETDASGIFGGNQHFRYIPTGYTTNMSDVSAGTVIMNDLAVRSIHSSFYVEDPSVTGNNIRPRTFIKGGEAVGQYVIFASGRDATTAESTKSPATVTDITHGIKLVHNIDDTPPNATVNLHNGSKNSAIVGMKFDISNGDVIAARDKFCILNSSGAVGVGGITPQELSHIDQNDLNRALHVSGNVMVGTQPGNLVSSPASSAMIMLNRATENPTTTIYPGIYHRNVTGTTAASLDLPSGSSGLGITSSDYITFQSGGASQNNSIVINGAGHVSVINRTNLNGNVSVGKNFVDVEVNDLLRPIIDISGTLSLSANITNYNDNPRIKLISKSIQRNLDVPSLLKSSTTNEIRGVIPTLDSGFLRLSAQTPANSCIDLIGSNTTSASRFNNSIRLSTSGVDALMINGNGHVGIGTTVPGVRLDVSGASSVTAARFMSTASTGTALITTGRIGINNSAPTTDLDVGGSIRVTPGNIDMNNTGRVINLLNPSNSQDAATKNYVDTITAGIANTTYVNSSLSTGTLTNNPTITDAANTSANYRVLFTTASLTGGNVGRGSIFIDSDLYYNPNGNILYATTFNGSLNGTASHATTAGSATFATTSTFANRADGRQFGVNGGSSYTITIPNDTMLDVYDPGFGHGARMRMRTHAGNGLTLGAHPGGESYFWNDQAFNIGFGTNNTRRMTLTTNGTLDMNSSTRIVSMPDPISSQDAATKNYVDNSLFNATSQNNPSVSDSGNSNQNFRLIYSTSTSGRATLFNDGELYYNPNNNTLYSGTFQGYLNGTAAYASSAGSASSATFSTFANRADGRQFSINGGSSYGSNIPTDSMFDIYDHGWGYGARMRMRTYAGNGLTLGCFAGGESYFWNEQGYNIMFGTSNARRMTLTSWGSLDMNGSTRITNMPNPSDSQDAATKAYVDNSLSGGGQTNNPTVSDSGNQWNNFRVPFSNTSSGRAALLTDGDLYYNPNNNTLYTGTFQGYLNGTAAYANSAGSASSSTFSTFANRADGRQFTINGGSGYGNNISYDSMFEVFDQGWGYGARMRMRTYAGNSLTIGAHAYGESYLWNEHGYNIGFGTSNTRRMTLTWWGSLDMNYSTRITNLPNPSDSQDAATKSYVDNILSSGSSALNPTIYDSGNQWNYFRLIFTTQSYGQRATLYNDGDLYYNPNNNTLYSGTFQGYLNGTASYSNSTGYASSSTYTYYPHIWDAYGGDSTVWNVVLTSGNGFQALHRSMGQYYNRFTCRPNFQGMMTVGFGTDDPQFPVHINAYKYHAWGGNWWDHWYVGLYNTYWGVTERGWGTVSDKRIKYDIRELNDVEALSDLRKLNPCKFKMHNNETRNEKYGFIAQEVIKVIPDAVIKMTNFVYNFNCYGEIKRINSDLSYNIFSVTYTNVNNKYPNSFVLKGDIGEKFIFESYTDVSGNKYKTANGQPATDISGNQHFRVKIVSLKDGITHECKVIEIIDEYNFTIAKEITDDITDDTYYIQGQETNDMHVLHNDVIWAISTSALQEVDRQQQADKLRIKELEEKVAEQQKLIDNILERLNKLGV